VEVGTNDNVPVEISTNTVAIVQTHPPSEGAGKGLEDAKNDKRNNGRLSQDERRMVRAANKHLNEEIPTYVATNDGSVTRFDPETRYRQGTEVAPAATVDFR